jgi:hypothetical protein
VNKNDDFEFLEIAEINYRGWDRYAELLAQLPEF